MIGLRFETDPPVSGANTHRMDVPLFVGYVDLRSDPPADVPSAITDWVGQHYADTPADLLDVAAPIEDWATFDRLFAWDARPLEADSDEVGDTYLGAAVRAFFAQGGHKCYVVRVGGAWPLDEGDDAATRAGKRRRRLARLIPGVRQYADDVVFDGAPGPDAGDVFSPHDQETWWGMAHLVGLPEASMVACPDLVELAADAPTTLESHTVAGAVPMPSFGPCDTAAVDTTSTADPVRRYPPPTVSEDATAVDDWREAVRLGVGFLARHRRDVQLVVSMPRFSVDHPLGRDLLGSAVDAGWLDPPDQGGIGSAFVQLAHPWLGGPMFDTLPGALAPPEGTLMGLLARSALTRGVQFSAGGSPAPEVVLLDPAPTRAEQLRLHPRTTGGAVVDRLRDRLTLFDYAAGGGVVLRSDVTASTDDDWRTAAVCRGMAVLMRVARDVGLAFTFETSGPVLWRRVTERFTSILQSWWRQGALRGSTPRDAFSVTCDRSTMTRSDLDAGRLICEVRFQPTHAISEITVVMTVADDGRVSAAGGEAAA